ncbi:unnamed protein product, partial [Adineta steineri]
NSTLRTLHLGKNGISNEDPQYLVDMLKINKITINVSLYDNLTNTLVHYNKNSRWLMQSFR